MRDQISEFWKLAPSLKLIDAIHLILGIEPQSAKTNDDDISTWPSGYVAVRESLVSAIQNNNIVGHIHYIKKIHYVDGVPVEQFSPEIMMPDIRQSWVEVEPLRQWLKDRGFSRGFFFPDQTLAHTFLDTTHPRFAPKLAAAVEAWEQYDSVANRQGSPKQRLQIWLRLNASRFGLTNEDGTPTETVIEDIAKIANWATIGGATKKNIPQVAPNPEDDIPL